MILALHFMVLGLHLIVLGLLTVPYGIRTILGGKSGEPTPERSLRAHRECDDDDGRSLREVMYH